jgi:hypothetical protein
MHERVISGQFELDRDSDSLIASVPEQLDVPLILGHFSTPGEHTL